MSNKVWIDLKKGMGFFMNGASGVGGGGHVDNTGSGGNAPPPTAAQINTSITAEKAKITAALNNLNSSTTTGKGLAAQLDQNRQLTQDLVNIQSQINELKASGAPAAEIATLESQLASVNQAMSQLLSGTEAVIFSAVQALELAAGVVAPAGSPMLAVPLANLRQELTVQDQAALFLAPSVITTIFRVMEDIMKQKLENIDTFRQYSWNSTGAQEKAALAGATAAVLEGQLDANAQRAQAIGTLVSAGLSMGLGFISIGLTIRETNKVDGQFKTEQETLDGQVGRGEISQEQHAERSQQLAASKHTAMQNALQHNPLLMTFQTLSQSAPEIARGVGAMIGAGFTEQAAYAKAAGMLWQQMGQAEQNITQEMQQAIQASSQDMSSIFDAFGNISRSVTGQG